MISISLRNFDMPTRAMSQASTADGLMLQARSVSGLIRLFIAIYRASFDEAGWEEVNGIFLSLCASFSADELCALRSIRESICDSEAPAVNRAADDALPLRGGSGDVVDVLRSIAAPAVALAFQQRSSIRQFSATEARLDLCFEHCMQGVMTFGPDGTCLFLNRAAARLLKLPVQARPQLIDRRILHRQLRKVVEEFMADHDPAPEWLSGCSIDIGGERVQCFPLVVAQHDVGSKALLHVFLTAETKSDELASRLLPHAHFSKQETCVLRALVEGKSNAAIARDMKLSVHTVRTYVERVYQKLNVANRHELMKLVISLTSFPSFAKRGCPPV